MDNKESIINRWIESSDEDFDTMLVLYETRKYHWALFIGHIVIEKLLKAYYVLLNDDYAPYTHNLYRLAELCSIATDEELADRLYRITTFNLNARYDDYKKEFYNLCTPEFAEEWINKIINLRKWLKQKF